MRGIMLLPGRYRVTDSHIEAVQGGWAATLVAGGRIFVPDGQLVAFETYEDNELERFRHRLSELRVGDNNAGRRQRHPHRSTGSEDPCPDHAAGGARPPD